MPSDVKALRTHLRIARQHAHTTDAERAEMEARLHESKAETARAHARAARSHAEAALAYAALAEVRRLCNLTIAESVRTPAIAQARDTLTAIDSVTEGQPLPDDAAWHSVWLHGNWRHLTKNMTTPEREHAADAVARYSAHVEPDEPAIADLRWWRD
jgi:tRNA-dihydrouridine synthase